MIDPKDNQDTSLIHRTTQSKPPRNLSHYLIGRPLQTADAPHQTIGKAVGLAVFASDALAERAPGWDLPSSNPLRNVTAEKFGWKAS